MSPQIVDCNLSKDNMAESVMYETTLSVHFSWKGGRYEPTIVCCKPYGDLMVRMDKETDWHNKWGRGKIVQ